MVAVVAAVLRAVAAGEGAVLRQALHPYLHWTEDGRTLRGRNTVLAALATRHRLVPPLPVELRDGQVYRWTAG